MQKCFLPLLLMCCPLASALPFVTTWRTTNAYERLVLPKIYYQTNVTIDWGDDSSLDTINANTLLDFVTHDYASPGLHNVSIEGQIFWVNAWQAATEKLMDIVSWGDGFLINQSSAEVFYFYTNLQVSAPPNTQPVFLPGASLYRMFGFAVSFNSSLDWDLKNVTNMTEMFNNAHKLNQPITFRNTQGVTTIRGLFSGTLKFNQPFHFDASGLLDASHAFGAAVAFNQVVNLTNSSKLTATASMFQGSWNYGSSFNQPITFNTDSVTNMQQMFYLANNFNQPVNFNVSQVTTMEMMFHNASKFNQPINFSSTSKLITTANMFRGAVSFNQPVVMDTSKVTTMNMMFAATESLTSTVNFTSTAKVTDMASMFSGINFFTQDLSSWDTSQVTACSNFCRWCGLPSFPSCVPCDPKYTNDQNLSVCSTLAPSAAPSASPSASPSSAPSSASPSSASPSTSSPSLAPSVAPSSPAPSTAPSPAPAVSAAARAPTSRGLMAALLALTAVGAY